MSVCELKPPLLRFIATQPQNTTITALFNERLMRKLQEEEPRGHSLHENGRGWLLIWDRIAVGHIVNDLIYRSWIKTKDLFANRATNEHDIALR